MCPESVQEAPSTEAERQKYHKGMSLGSDDLRVFCATDRPSMPGVSFQGPFLPTLLTCRSSSHS